VAIVLGFGPEPIPDVGMAFVNWIASVIAVYASVFAVGAFLTSTLQDGLLYSGIAVTCFALIGRNLSRTAGIGKAD
jgi:hypothetical protein